MKSFVVLLTLSSMSVFATESKVVCDSIAYNITQFNTDLNLLEKLETRGINNKIKDYVENGYTVVSAPSIAFSAPIKSGAFRRAICVTVTKP